MEIMPSTYYDNLKRLWKRRQYQRFNSSNNKKKLKIARLGGSTRRLWKLRRTPKLQMKIVSPIKLLAKFHNVYVDMMIRLANNAGKLSNNGFFKGKKVARGQHISMVSSGEEVDSRLVMEIYKRIAASRDLSAF